jgi:flavodoxin
MRALVVYESMFGNTRAVATAIARGLATRMAVDLIEVGIAPDRVDDGVDLVVAGGPTHAFSMSRPNTRKSAADQADEPLVSTGRGLRDWLDAAGPTLRGRAVATFDTKIEKAYLPGSAARSAHKRLRRLGCRPVASAENFIVLGTTGPLADGELDRATRWGEHLTTLSGESATV